MVEAEPTLLTKGLSLKCNTFENGDSIVIQ